MTATALTRAKGVGDDSTSTRAIVTRGQKRPPAPRSMGRANIVSTAILVIGGALYAILPVVWILIASTKSASELFSTPTALPSFTGGFFENISELFAYRDGVFGLWMLNSALYAGGGGVLSTLIAAAAGYSLAKYRFRGSTWIFRLIVAGVLLPQILLAIPQYLLLAQVGMTNSYLSVILPLLVSPYAIYLCKIYAESSVPDEIMEAARIDGASEWRIFTSTGLRLMRPRSSRCSSCSSSRSGTTSCCRSSC